MTIKQQGGVFGRNPSFNDVNIDTLTVDSSASINGPLDCDGFTSNGQSNFVGTLGTVYVDSQGAYINFTRNSGNYIRTTGASSSLYLSTAAKNRLGILSTGDIYLYKDDGVTVGATWDASAGNLAFASGQGIDFSATSGTGTSELFNDYEEGTFTPNIIGSVSAGTGTYAYRIGRYTKIGDRVLFNLIMSWSAHTGTGFMRIDGLPFTSMASSPYYHAVNIGYIDNVATTAGTVPSGFVLNNSTQIWMGQIPTGGGAWAYMGIDTAGAINISGQYEV